MKALRTTIRKAIDNLPFVDTAQRHHPVEYALINGTAKSKSEHISILHFSLNKAATQYVKKILNEAASSLQLSCANLNGYAFHSDFPYVDLLNREEFEAYQYIFQPKGYLYSVFGGMIDGLKDLPQYLVVLMVRDPRDILVSSYFSTAYSHPLPGKNSDKADDFYKKRTATQQLTIDEYVMKESEIVLNVYNRYIDLLLNQHPNCYITKYEEMITDHEQWLSNLLAYCQLDISPTLKEKLLQQNRRLKPKKENINDHMRKGIAGDFKEKLKEDTIITLNDKFAHILDRFGYRI